MPYKALTYIRLRDAGDADGEGVVKSPGDTITKAEFSAAGQADSISALLKSGAISEDMDAEIHADHAPVEPRYESEGNHVVATDGGSGNERN